MPETHDSELRLSVSQYNTYAKCPYSWFLDKRANAWKRPAAWLAQGTAVHTGGEAYEKSGRRLTLEEFQNVYAKSYKEEIDRYAEETPNLDWWFASGRYRGREDIERRYGLGLEMCERYISWYQKHPHEVPWTAPNGTLGVELPFDIYLDGVNVRGYIDLVIWDSKRKKLVVRDNKTGKVPGDDFQLGTYGVALEVDYDENVNEGDYWMGTSGKATMPYDLTDMTRDYITEEFHKLAENIRAERFDPDPEPDKCRFCSVAYACDFSL
ncbi:RecB family exonuclease [Nocardia cyriacigeorgica]|uniref:RecB family exonuclease n=1 Tax=Nocardia cyriacigeorgica TaxID=135487 RepID=UPI002459119C|nr:PD-(D/E)XK nuclease family protein [Nocardia cyriacigeorgica]